MQYSFPTLYKKTNTGAIQYWHIFVKPSEFGPEGIIFTEYGQVGTDNPQVTQDEIREGKNLGKKNQTTPEDQAKKEAQSKWQKQIDSGYVDSIAKAEAGETSRTGTECMLAHEYGYVLNKVFFPDQAKKAKFPAAIQPKLDGIRAPEDDQGNLKSREHKPINSVPHIVEAIKELDLVSLGTDGELYNHAYKAEFEKITSIVNKKNEVDPDHKLVEYHIYDLSREDLTFVERQELIRSRIPVDHPYLKIVPTTIVNSHEEIMEALYKYRALGYEGVMVRNLNSKYEGKRSYNLLKLKEFFEEEFVVIDVQEGRGKLQGHLGAFICKTPEGNQFKVSMKCTQERKKEFWETQPNWVGKQLTVRFQGYTAKNKVPRFPEGIRFREEGF